MIERIYAQEQLSGLPAGVESGKILALFAAYGGGYDFCKFFRQSGSGSAYIAALDGSFVISGAERADFSELAQFLSIHGFADIFCSYETGERFRDCLDGEYTAVDLMEYAGGKSGAEPPERTPSEVWEIIGSRFDIPFEPWYLDMSHRVRHGISRCFSDGNAALVIQHSISGEVLLSQVCVRRECEGKGFAGRLLRAVCGSVPGRVQVVCADELVGFYEKCGFVPVGKKYVVTA